MRNYKIRFQIHDLLFFLLLFVSFYFTRNIVCSLLMVLFFGYTIARQITRRKKSVFPFYILGMSVFILWGAANIVFDNVLNVKVARTMVISLTLNIMMIFAIVQYIVIRRDVPKILQILERAILAAALLVVALSMGTLLQGRLAKGTEMNANTLAMLSVYGLTIAVYLRKIGKLINRNYRMRLVVYIAVILLTGSRKGLAMMLLSLMVIAFINGRRKLVKNIFLGMVGVAVIYAAIMNVEFLYNIIGVRVESLLTLVESGSTGENSLNDRMKLVAIGMEYIKEKPWTGYGYDCFKTVTTFAGGGRVSNGFGYYSHNNYVELLFSGGIIGLVLYYFPILSLLQKMIRNLKKDPCMTYLLAILVSKLAVEYAYVSYYDRIDAYIHGILLGCVVVAGRNPGKHIPENS